MHTTAQQPANKRSVHAIISRRKRSKVLFNDAGFQIRKRLAAELYLALNGRPPVGDGRYGPLGAWSALRHAIAAVCPRHLYRLQNHEDCYQQGSYRARIFPEVAHCESNDAIAAENGAVCASRAVATHPATLSVQTALDERWRCSGTPRQYDIVQTVVSLLEAVSRGSAR